MITIHNQGMTWQKGQLVPAEKSQAGVEATMAYSILKAHNTSGSMERLSLRFDAMASHDITYVGIIQTARASGLTEFPLPYVLTNCHNSLCAVGGTINEDDHNFGLSAAKKYGGEFVPAHQAVIHSYMRERYAAPGKMILGSDSHTRYGAYGCMAIGEGGPELARQLLCKTYDIAYPQVVGIYLTGAPRPGVGPQDVALALVKATFQSGAVKNAVMEFFGPGVANLSMDYRSGIDVMTTETTCLSSVWQTDTNTQTALTLLGRGAEYHPMQPSCPRRPGFTQSYVAFSQPPLRTVNVSEVHLRKPPRRTGKRIWHSHPSVPSSRPRRSRPRLWLPAPSVRGSSVRRSPPRQPPPTVSWERTAQPSAPPRPAGWRRALS